MPPREQLNAVAAERAPAGAAVTGQLLRITTALAVVAGGRRRDHLLAARLRTGAVAGESGATARLAPFTVDGLILAASMVMLDASRRSQRVPPLAGWSLAVGLVATVGANLAHGVVRGPIGALVSVASRGTCWLV
jgi:hypothetical protein